MSSIRNERRTVRDGPLHGIPVLIKDNIDTADRMATTAGSLALVGSKPPGDASLVKRLRQAGAIILGKTNLSEWANIRNSRSTSGWSGRGGLTRNPYAWTVIVPAQVPDPERLSQRASAPSLLEPRQTARSLARHPSTVSSASNRRSA